MNRFAAAAVAAGLPLCLAPGALAQWDPFNGDWTKEDPRDLRVMTWNVQDAICSSSDRKQTGAISNWDAVVRTIAAMKPDVVLLQEMGDNSGNGTGSGVDSVSEMETTIDLMLNGGADPFRGGTVSSYVAFYDQNVNFPFVYVSTIDDGFNRNVVLSRYPFVDLNGDTKPVIPSIPGSFPGPNGWPAGGQGGIRGFILAEIDLPDADYAGDVVVGNAHLKAGGDSDDLSQRLTAAKNVGYYIDAVFNGLGGSTPDPENRFFDSPQVQTVLGENTPVIYGGDWNEDESQNGRRGPAAWLTEGPQAGGTDGVDRDRSDALLVPAVDLFNSDDDTQGGSTLDYIAHQDSIATLRRGWIFNSQSTGTTGRPPELVGFPFNPSLVSGTASDHLAVVADFVLPEPVVIECPPDFDDTGVVDAADLSVLLANWGVPSNPDADLANDDGLVDAADLSVLLAFWGACPQ